MPAINFPTPTQVGEFHISDGKTWRWDGTAWKSYGNSAPGPTGPLGPTGPASSVTGPTGPGLTAQAITMSMIFGG